MTPPLLDEFVKAAREFCSLAEQNLPVNETDLWKIRELLLRLIFHIPAVELAPLGTDFDGMERDEEEYARIARRFGGFEFNAYRFVFDPHDLDAVDEPVMGMLSDDLADIYRELAIGLSNADQRHLDEACFDWSFGYRSHWARHAVNALAAIELYRTDNYKILG